MIKVFEVWKDYIKKLLYIMTKQQRFIAIILLTVVLINAFLQTLGVYIISPFVSSMTNKEIFLGNDLIKKISNIFRIDNYTYLFCLLCGTIAFIYFIKELVSVFQTWFSIKFAQKVQREISKSVLDSYISRDYDFFLNYGTPKLLRDIKEDPSATYNILTCLLNIITEVITAIFLFIYIVISDYNMALLLIALAAVSMLVMIYGFKRTLLKRGIEARERAAENHKILLESVEGIKEVKVMRKQHFFSEAFLDTYSKAQKPLVFQNFAASAPTYIVEGIFVIGIMIYLGIKALNDSQFWNELPLLASFLVASIRLLPSIGRITNNINNIQFFVPALESVYNNVRIIRDNSVLSKMKPDEDNGNDINFENSLQLKGISYHYQNNGKNILDGLDLVIHKGESVGIIGQSGAGKSTLADIILGLHIPQKGEILIDGINITDIPYEYSRVIGYVPQNVYLVDGTIRENIAFGEEKNSIDDKRIEISLKQSKLYDFVMNMEDGLDTIVGERGVKFSGGQRQRLAIARALYRNPQILILDEATAALDNDTESAVMEQIEELQGTITLIIIAHRLSTIKKCDSVYEVVGGKAVEVNEI